MALIDESAISEAYIKPSQHVRRSSFWYYLKAFRHYVMLPGAPCLLLWTFYICLCILLSLLLLLLLLLPLLLLLLISFLLSLLLLESLLRAVYYSHKVNWPIGFFSFNFFICVNLIFDVIWTILCLTCLLLDIFLIRDVEDAFNPMYLMGCWESNPVKPCLLRRKFIYMRYYPLGGSVAYK